MFHGDAGAREAAVYAVSHVERYLECPFKYFAAHVLRLPEERDEESGLTPQERGQFRPRGVRAVLRRVAGVRPRQHHDGERRRCGRAVRARRGGAPGDAVRSRIARWSGRTCSARPPRRASRERAFAFEIEQGGDVVERLLEHQLEGEFAFATAAGPRTRAAARQGGSHRPAGRRHAAHRRLQARQGAEAGARAAAADLRRVRAAGARGASRPLVDARRAPATWRSGRRTRSSASGPRRRCSKALAAGQERLLAAIDGIERGEFPATAGRAVPLHAVRLRVGVPQGLRRR